LKPASEIFTQRHVSPSAAMRRQHIQPDIHKPNNEASSPQRTINQPAKQNEPPVEDDTGTFREVTFACRQTPRSKGKRHRKRRRGRKTPSARTPGQSRYVGAGAVTSRTQLSDRQTAATPGAPARDKGSRKEGTYIR
jgi:hypothetical protein